MIAIQGLKMPTDCLSCPFVTGAFGICDHINYTRVPGHRLADCPLREVKPLENSRLVKAEDYEVFPHRFKAEMVLPMARLLFATHCIHFEAETAARDWPEERKDMVELRSTVAVVLPNGRT